MTITPPRLADAQSFATVRLIEQARSRAATALEPLLRTHLAELGNAAILLLTRKPDPQTWTPDEHLAYIIATRDFSDVMAARRERAPDDATTRSDAAGRSQSDTDPELIEEIPF